MGEGKYKKFADNSAVDAHARDAAKAKSRGIPAGANRDWIPLITVNDEIAKQIWWRFGLKRYPDYDVDAAFVNDCQIRLYESLNHYRYPHPWRPWAYTCCRNRALDIIGGHKPPPPPSPPPLPELPGNLIADFEDKCAVLQSIVERLPPGVVAGAVFDRRTAFHLFLRKAMYEVILSMRLDQLDPQDREMRQIRDALKERGGEFLRWTFANSYSLLITGSPCIDEIWRKYIIARQQAPAESGAVNSDLLLFEVCREFEGIPVTLDTFRRWRSRSVEYAKKYFGVDDWDTYFEHFLLTRERD